MSRDSVVYGSIVGLYFNLKNCAYFHDWFHFVVSSVSYVVSTFFGKNLFVQLKQSGEKLKGDVWLLDYLVNPDMESSRKRNLHVRRTTK